MSQMQNASQDLPGAVWRKSGRSGAQGNCVELAAVPAREVAVRNSRFPAGPALLFEGAEMSAFIADIKRGAYDDLITDDR